MSLFNLNTMIRPVYHTFNILNPKSQQKPIQDIIRYIHTCIAKLQVYFRMSNIEVCVYGTETYVYSILGMHQGLPPSKLDWQYKRDYTEFNKIRTSFYIWLGLDPLPASTGIQARLCWETLLVEIEAIAISKSN